MTLERVTKNVRCNGRQSRDLAVNVVISKKAPKRERETEKTSLYFAHKSKLIMFNFASSIFQFDCFIRAHIAQSLSQLSFLLIAFFSLEILTSFFLLSSPSFLSLSFSPSSLSHQTSFKLTWWMERKKLTFTNQTESIAQRFCCCIFSFVVFIISCAFLLLLLSSLSLLLKTNRCFHYNSKYAFSSNISFFFWQTKSCSVLKITFFAVISWRLTLHGENVRQVVHDQLYTFQWRERENYRSR